MQFNRGEWSELYALLELLDKPELNIVNENLEIIDNNTFKVFGLYIQNSKNEYYFDIKKLDIEVLKNNNVFSNVSKNEIQKYKEVLLNKILNELPGTGSFPIDEMKQLLNKLTEGNKIKSSSSYKTDINAKIKDNKINTINKVGYSIKSSLGSPATLLNASANTNFKYKINGLTENDVKEINSINTSKKLVDRLKYMKNKKCSITFEEVISESMNHNLKMIDTYLPQLLGKILLLSYNEEVKNIQKLLEIATKKNIIKYDGNSKLYYNKKIGDFLLAITFGMMPGNIWDGNYDVTGGIILVENNGEVLVLDAIYYKEYLVKYLIKNTKLDSPSSSRYKMFEIYKENGQNYFNLNLQIRFIR